VVVGGFVCFCVSLRIDHGFMQSMMNSYNGAAADSAFARGLPVLFMAAHWADGARPGRMEMSQNVWFAVLMVAVLIWFVLVSMLYRLLRESHAAVFESLGSPSLFLNNTIKNGLLTLKFLATGSFRELGDRRLTRLGTVMQIYFVAYMIWFLAPIVSKFLTP
jgi:hypothetical protein